jgi:hypothetical protein
VLTYDITQFPVLVYLSSSSGKTGKDLTSIFTEIGSDANRKKIAITKADGTTQLNIEIEKWDNANQKAWLWVSQAGWIISYTSDTVIYIYYDSTRPDNTTYVGDKGSTPAKAVWDSYFKMVQHMDESATPIVDSTSNGNNGAEGSHTPSYGQTGKVGKGISLNGSSDRFRVTGLDNEAPIQFTIEAWIKTSQSGEASIFPRTTINDNYNYKDWMLGLRYNKAHAEANVGTTNRYFVDSATSVNNNAWHHIVAVYLGLGGLYIYVDGVQDGMIDHIGGSMVNYYAATNIGVGQYSYNDFELWFNGLLDEVRYANIGRTPNWVHTDYVSQNDGLVTYGNEEATSSYVQLSDTLTLSDNVHVTTPQGSSPTVLTHGATNVGVY